MSEISIFRDVNDQHSLAPLLENIGDILKFFHQTGDLQGKHNLPGEPMADPFTGLFFAIGVAYAILAWRDQRRVLLLLWLVLGLAGSYLSSHHELPQSYRALTALPAVVLLAADVLDQIARAAYKWLREQRFALTCPSLAPIGRRITRIGGTGRRSHLGIHGVFWPSGKLARCAQRLQPYGERRRARDHRRAAGRPDRLSVTELLRFLSAKVPAVRGLQI